MSTNQTKFKEKEEAKMMSFQEFLDEPISINKRFFMRREDYYKKYIQNCEPKKFYDQLVRIEKENNNEV